MVMFETVKGARIVRTIDIFKSHDPAIWPHLPYRYEQYAQGDGYPDYALAMTYPAMFPVCELKQKHCDLCDIVGIRDPWYKRLVKWVTGFNHCLESLR